MLGALIRASKLVSLDSLNAEVLAQLGDRIGEKNVTVIQRAHDEVKHHG
jgi:Pyruvate/2-oxoacid:ferredoxin oxidoreductase gamma subunit